MPKIVIITEVIRIRIRNGGAEILNNPSFEVYNGRPYRIHSPLIIPNPPIRGVS